MSSFTARILQSTTGGTRPRTITAGAARGLRVLALLACARGLAGCHQEPPPPLYTGVSPDQSNEASPEPAPPEAQARALWFADGPGREALLARERRDHATAIASLDALLADPSLSAEDRGAAQLLRALEDVEAERYMAGADRLAQARKTAALAPLDVWLRATEAQARLDASQPELALELVRDVHPTPALAERMLVIEADARFRTDDEAGARAGYERYLEQFPDGGRRQAVRLRLADLLISAGAYADASALLERVVLAVPLSQYGLDAEDRLRGLEKAGHRKLDAKQRRRFEREQALAEIRDRLDRRDYARAVKQADAFFARKDLPAAEECEARFLQASAVFKQRERSRARDYYERAAKQCKKAGSTDEVVKSRYQSARGRYAQGHYQDAARDFEKLAADHPTHSYADDALIKAGESWEEAGEPAKAEKAYAKALEPAVRGDMAEEASRRLLVQAFAQKRFDDARALADGALAGGVANPRERARLHYFRGRALAELGRTDEAEQAWLSAVAEMPLSYPSAQALSRLRDLSPDALARGLRALESDGAAATPGPSLELPDDPAVVRARLFARLGLGDEAREELDAAGVDGWPAAALLSQAGLYDAVQRKLANLGLGWRAAPPDGARRPLWEIAHPTPFTEIIDPGEKEHGVPPFLTFAIMQTESRFNPGVTSWAGAKGLVQLMPGTAKTVADRAGLELAGDDVLYDPATNLGLGMRYLAQLTRRWGGGDAGPALAIPSYNAGAGSVDKWVAERGDWPLDLFIESIPYDETRRYTQNVLERWAVYRWMYGEGDARLLYLPAHVPKRAD